MAFDLKGANPQGYDGEWIRLNVWSWHRLWRGFRELFPDDADIINLWYINSNEFISEEACQKIADKIELYGDERFALYLSKIDLPLWQDNWGDKALYSAFLTEIPFFIKFLRSCGGFYLK